MNLFLMLNYEMIEIPCEKFYMPIVFLDLREYKLTCQEVNSFMILMRNPRTNIDLLSGVFQFFFESSEQIGDSFLGQVQSNLNLIYNMNNTKFKDSLPFIIFTQGYQLIELLLYLPAFKQQTLLREIVYRSHSIREGECPICMEQKNLVNLHQNEFHHEVCKTCLFRLTQCPMCRIDL